MASTIGDLTSGRHTPLATVLGWLGLAAFIVPYFYLVLSRRPRVPLAWWQVAVLGWLYTTAAVLTLTLGAPWLVLFVYVSIGAGVMLPYRQAAWAVPLSALSLLGLGKLVGAGGWLLAGEFLPALLGGAAMMGIAQMRRTMRELREARETVAHLAANEERPRAATRSSLRPGSMRWTSRCSTSKCRG
jgi:two-component system sensor histidine kinase DesK